METALPSDGSGMDSLFALGSRLPVRQSNSPANLVAAAASDFLLNEPGGAATVLEAPKHDDPADDRQRMMHFISHIDAACFISLLQTVDPMPDDYRARAEYKRFYRQLRDSLEVPLPPSDSQPSGFTTDIRG
jgi:hypothetical protein